MARRDATLSTLGEFLQAHAQSIPYAERAAIPHTSTNATLGSANSGGDS